MEQEWGRRWAQFLKHEPTVFPSPLAGNKSNLSTSPQVYLRIFSSALVGREGQDFGRNNTRQSILICLSENRRVIEFSEALLGLPGWLSGKESACQCRRWRRQEFGPWVAFLPWQSQTEKSGGLWSMGSQRVSHDWVTQHACTHAPQSSSNR